MLYKPTKIRYSYGGRFVQFRFCRCEIMIIFDFSPQNNDKTTRNNETNKKALISTMITINFVISEWSRKDANLHLFVVSLFLGEVGKEVILCLFVICLFARNNEIVSFRLYHLFATKLRCLSLFRGEKTKNCGAKCFAELISALSISFFA